MPERGEIKNRKYALQIRDFRKLRWGNITPTDIDMFIDFNNHLFIWGELKHGDSEVPQGQRLALERINDSTERSGIESCTFIASHNSEGDIDVAEAKVVEYRYHGQWIKPEKNLTILQAITRIKEMSSNGKCKVCGTYEAILFFEGKHICDTCYTAEKGWRQAR